MTGICQLCKKEKELIRRSHIWPNFMYSGMHDEKGRLYVINSQRPNNHHTVQSGAYQQYIFCATCDNEILGKLERYASNNLFRKSYLENNADFEQITIPPGEVVIHCSHIDYKAFKLFLLSLLWRASISTEPLFENFTLSEQENEILRTAIYEDTVVAEELFPCLLLTAPYSNPDENFIAIDPFKPGIVKFYINGFVYTFYLDKRKVDEGIREMMIKMNNQMGILKISVDQWKTVMLSVVDAAAAASKPNL